MLILFAAVAPAGAEPASAPERDPRQVARLVGPLAALGASLLAVLWSARALGRQIAAEGHLRREIQRSAARRAARRCDDADGNAAKRTPIGQTLRSGYLAEASYAMRSSLTAVIALARLLQEGELAESQRDHVRTMGEAAESLIVELDDLLDHTRLAVGTLRLEDQAFELDSCLDDVFAMLQPRFVERGVTISCRTAPDVPARLVGDVARVRRVLVNLLGSAARFAVPGRVTIEIECAKCEERRVELAVRVGGVRTAPPPETEADERRSSLASHALGVYPSRRLVERMGGSLEAAIGTDRVEYRVTLPLAWMPGRGDGARGHDELLAGMRLLVVDDDDVDRRVVGEIVTGWGMECVESADGRQALNLLRTAAAEERAFDVALISRELRGMDGIRLGRKISRNPAFEATRIVFTTRAAPDPLLASDDAGPAAFAKPIRPAVLRDALRRALDGGGDPFDARTAEERTTLDVLLVEDNPINQKAFRALLMHRGCAVDVVGTRAEAVHAVALKAYDLVFMDARKGLENGCVAIREVKRELGALGRSAPVIGITAAAARGERELCLEAGMDDYLFLPIRLEELGEVLRRWGTRRTALPPRSTAAVAAGGDEAGLDLETIRMLRELGGDDDPDLFVELVSMFLRDTPPRLASLLVAVESADWGALEQAAHSLKSSCAHLGARQLSLLSSELEDVSRDGHRHVEAPALVSRAMDEFLRVEAALRRMGR